MKVIYNKKAENIIRRFAELNNITSNEALENMIKLMEVFNINATKGYQLGIINPYGASLSMDSNDFKHLNLDVVVTK